MWILFESVAIRASDGKGGKEAWRGWIPVSDIGWQHVKDDSSCGTITKPTHSQGGKHGSKG